MTHTEYQSQNSVSVIRSIYILKLVLLIVLVFSSMMGCIGPTKFTRLVQTKIDTDNTVLYENPINTTFDFSRLPHLNAPVVSTKLKSIFVPAIIVWYSNVTIKCDISPALTGETFRDHFSFFADSLNLQEKLNGQKLEIAVEKVPSSFVYSQSTTAIFALVAAISSSNVYIQPLDQKLVVRYKVSNDSGMVKEGTVEAYKKELPYGNLRWSTKKFVWNYMDRFKRTNRILSLEIVEKLLKEL